MMITLCFYEAESGTITGVALRSAVIRDRHLGCRPFAEINSQELILGSSLAVA
jgi:hypothetical protein